MQNAYLILTDSGGVQEEAPSLGKPVLVMQNTTERPEAIKAGTVELVGTDTNTIVSACLTLLNDENKYLERSKKRIILMEMGKLQNEFVILYLK